jgi:Carboxypeptidase regulatory-like domain
MVRTGVSFAAVLLLSASVGFGQTASATITGTISDPTGAAVAGAPLEVHNLETGAVFKVASSQTGNYTVSQLPVGDYDLTVGVAGFTPEAGTLGYRAGTVVARFQF